MAFLSRIYMTLAATIFLAFAVWLVRDPGHVELVSEGIRSFTSGRLPGAPVLAPAASEPYAPRVVYLKDNK